jgi:hypothetical protein
MLTYAVQVVEQMLAGGVPMESAADKLLKFSADFGAGMCI